jgi:hypothetical protein
MPFCCSSPFKYFSLEETFKQKQNPKNHMNLTEFLLRYGQLGPRTWSSFLF